MMHHHDRSAAGAQGIGGHAAIMPMVPAVADLLACLATGLGLHTGQADPGAPQVSDETAAAPVPAGFLFTVGMSLVLGIDVVIMMLKTNRWAQTEPCRRRVHHRPATAIPGVSAFRVAAPEIANFPRAQLDLRGGFRSLVGRLVGSLGDHVESMGAIIVIALSLIWSASVLTPRIQTGKEASA